MQLQCTIYQLYCLWDAVSFLPDETVGISPPISKNANHSNASIGVKQNKRLPTNIADKVFPKHSESHSITNIIVRQATKRPTNYTTTLLLKESTLELFEIFANS